MRHPKNGFQCGDGSSGLASVVVPIDKLSIVVIVVFSYFVFHEQLSKRAGLGLIFIVTGTFVMLV